MNTIADQYLRWKDTSQTIQVTLGFWQRILKGSEGALCDEDEITAPLDLQLVILDFWPPDENADAEFIDACTRSHMDKVEAMLQRPQNPDTRDSDGWPALHFAAQAGNTSCVELLLESLADLEMRATEDGSTALHCAASNGHVRVLELLLHCGAEKDCALTNGCTPLHCASSNGHLNVVRLLLRANAEKNSVRPDGATPLHFAAKCGHLEVVQVLLDSGVEKNRAMTDGATPLQIAAHAGHLEVVQLLLDSGAEINSAMIEGATPLHGAALAGHLEVVQLLLDSGADRKSATTEGITPLYFAATFGHLEVVERLLDSSGSEKNSATTEGFTSTGVTAFNFAIKQGNLEAAAMLFIAGVEIDWTDDDLAAAIENYFREYPAWSAWFHLFSKHIECHWYDFASLMRQCAWWLSRWVKNESRLNWIATNVFRVWPVRFADLPDQKKTYHPNLWSQQQVMYSRFCMYLHGVMLYCKCRNDGSVLIWCHAAALKKTLNDRCVSNTIMHFLQSPLLRGWAWDRTRFASRRGRSSNVAPVLSPGEFTSPHEIPGCWQFNDEVEL